jgi:hypothetical protein
VPSAIELPESDVAAVLAQGKDGLVIRFRNARVHRWAEDCVAGEDTFFPAEAEIAFGEATYAGTLGNCHGRLTDGFLRFNERSSTAVPVPLESRGGVWAQLVFASGAILTVVAKSVCTLLTQLPSRGAMPLRVKHSRPPAKRPLVDKTRQAQGTGAETLLLPVGPLPHK